MSNASDSTADDRQVDASGSASNPVSRDRGISPVAGRLGHHYAGKAAGLAALALGSTAILAATWDRTPAVAAKPAEPVRQVVTFEPKSSDPSRHPTLADPGPNAPTLSDTGPKVPALEEAPSDVSSKNSTPRGSTATARSQAISLMAYSRGSPGRPDLEPRTLQAATPSAPADATELERLRRGSTISTLRADQLPDRNFLILAGAVLPCILTTALDSATPGHVACLLPRDVYSDNGAVVLLEKGAKVLGEYRGGLQQGQQRIFVAWTRVVTPAGVAIALSSPAADALGRAGFDGDIDTHFWDRFGGALLLSLVDDGTGYVVGEDGGRELRRLPSPAAAVALQGSNSIRPTLRKAQGAEVSIFVAHDLDFSSVYRLRRRP